MNATLETPSLYFKYCISVQENPFFLRFSHRLSSTGKTIKSIIKTVKPAQHLSMLCLHHHCCSWIESYSLCSLFKPRSYQHIPVGPARSPVQACRAVSHPQSDGMLLSIRAVTGVLPCTAMSPHGSALCPCRESRACTAVPPRGKEAAPHRPRCASL